jgi:CopG family nickel-responsive transcriptional regulator
MSDLVRQSFSLEQPLLDRLDRLVAQSQYTNRSEFLRDLIRDRLVEQAWEENEEALATVTLIYDHHAHDLSRKLTDLQHAHHGNVLATTHVHLDHHLCAEMIMIRGRAAELRALADQIRRLRGVLHAALAMSSTGKQLV